MKLDPTRNSSVKESKNIPNAINVLRVVACMCVLVLHAIIYTYQAGFDIYSFFEAKPWVYILKTPAWAGVWIFYVISAYLAGRGFFTGRYKYNIKGFLTYYYKKVLRIIIPVYAFIFITCVFAFPEFLVDNPGVFWDLLLFQYDGNVGVDGIGALWYVSSIMRVYLVTPFICLLLDKTIGWLCRKKETIGKLLVAVLMLAIAAWGYFNRMSLLESGAPWGECVYTNVFANADFFLCGFLLNFITLKNSPQKNMPPVIRTFFKIVSCLLLLSVIAYASYLYFAGEWFAPDLLYIYQYQMQTPFLIVICLYLFAFDYEKDYKQAPLTPLNCLKNPLRILDFLSDLSFEIYMFHSLIFGRMVPFWGEIRSLGKHLCFIVVGLLLSILCGYAFQRIFLSRKNSNSKIATK